MAFVCSMSVGVLSRLTRRSWQSVRQSSRAFCTMSSPLDKIPSVDIDCNGTFKYILVHIHDDVNKMSKDIVRGYARCTWHGIFSSWKRLNAYTFTIMDYEALRKQQHAL